LKTFKRWKNRVEDIRNGPLTVPANKLTIEEREEVLKIATSNNYMDLPPCQIVPLLADRGKYVASESTFYKILNEEKLLKHRGKSKAPTKHRPSPLIATKPNQIYSWDITYLKGPIVGQFYYLYMFMDIYSRKIVGYEINESESMEYSSKLIDEICEKEKIKKGELVLHSDNGGAMKGATMLATLQKLGVIPSFSRPSVSNDNPFSESLFKTLKYCPEYPSRPFLSLEEAWAWVKAFVEWYNYCHLHSGIKFVTPNDRHEGRDKEILRKRKIVYETAKLKNPNRWSRQTRNWEKIRKVYLNYLQKEKEIVIKIASQ
jgi:putative transposase